MFFVNLEPSPNNSEVKTIEYIIYHTRVVIEDSRRSKDIPQCTRCQQYGHTKNNCMHPYRCVKCVEGHKTTECPKKDRNTPATYILLWGPPSKLYRIPIKRSVIENLEIKDQHLQWNILIHHHWLTNITHCHSLVNTIVGPRTTETTRIQKVIRDLNPSRRPMDRGSETERTLILSQHI